MLLTFHFVMEEQVYKIAFLGKLYFMIAEAVGCSLRGGTDLGDRQERGRGRRKVLVRMRCKIKNIIILINW